MFEIMIIVLIIMLACIYLAYKEGAKEGYAQGAKDFKEIFNLVNDLVFYAESGNNPKVFLKIEEIRRKFPSVETVKERFRRERQEMLNTELPKN